MLKTKRLVTSKSSCSTKAERSRTSLLESAARYGEHDVAVKFDRLKWSDSAATTGSGQPASQTKKVDRNYPDHAVLNATKDQLKAMPNFQYSK